MPLKVAVQMDPIEGVNIDSDTTFLMMLSAQARGHSLFVYTPDRLAMEDGRVMARGRNVSVKPERLKEIEYGVDAGFLSDRVRLEATYYDRSIVAPRREGGCPLGRHAADVRKRRRAEAG